MPIRPENRALYPKNWKSEVVPRIRRRSGNRCECTGQCGHVHHGTGITDLQRCTRWHLQLFESAAGNEATIILTVAHLNHQPEDCRDENLLHLCQACHLRYDAPVKAAGIRARAKAARAVADLFQCVPITTEGANHG